MEKNEKNLTKTQVFNVIILDRSGFMERIRQAAINGFNEMLSGIKRAQKKFAGTQDHFVTLLTFCDCEKKYVFDKVPVADVRKLTSPDYEPCCCTPLYDAMGFTLTNMRNHVKNIEDSVVVVTIITDGLENASKEFTGTAVKQLVEKLKCEGWTFTYMGANQDSMEIAFNLSIRNARNFEYSSEGTMAGMVKDSNTRMNFYSRLAKAKDEENRAIMGCSMNGAAASVISTEERRARYTAMADEAFDEEEGKE